jgi:hypothetical protein
VSLLKPSDHDIRFRTEAPVNCDPIPGSVQSLLDMPDVAAFQRRPLQPELPDKPRRPCGAAKRGKGGRAGNPVSRKFAGSLEPPDRGFRVAPVDAVDVNRKSLSPQLPLELRDARPPRRAVK